MFFLMFDFTKLKALCSGRETIMMKWKFTEWERIFASCTSDRGLRWVKEINYPFWDLNREKEEEVQEEEKKRRRKRRRRRSRRRRRRKRRIKDKNYLRRKIVTVPSKSKQL